jgi:hypothetical protein
LLEWCRAYREDHSQGLVDKRVGGNRAKLSSNKHYISTHPKND